MASGDPTTDDFAPDVAVSLRMHGKVGGSYHELLLLFALKEIEHLRTALGICETRQPYAPTDDMTVPLAVELAAAEAKIERLLGEVRRRELALQSLTSGGSEYVDDPERCVAYVQDRLRRQHEMVVRLTKQAREALGDA